MKKTKNSSITPPDQRGFATILIVLLGSLLIAGVAYLAYANYSKSYPKSAKNSPTPTLTPIASSTSIPTATPSPSADEHDLIEVAVGSFFTVGRPYITISDIQGNNARGSLSDGMRFVVHKSASGWDVVYHGSTPPCSTVGTQYGLPTAWLSASC